MFSFIWHLKGAVPLENRLTNEAALDRVEWLLDKQLLFHRKREADLLIFNEPFLKNPFGPNWLAMVIYDQGRFWIEQRKDSRQLRYDLRSLHGMVFCMLFASISFVFGLGQGGLASGAKYATGAFAWLYGVNLFLAHARVPQAIERAVLES